MAAQACATGFECVEADGKWSCEPEEGADAGTKTTSVVNAPAADCSDDPCDANASCSEREDGVVCECNDGFVGNGTACQRSDCDALTIGNGQVDCPGGAESGDTCTFSCDPGYTLSGTEERTCQANGSWTGSRASCENVNECADGDDDCDANASCTDTSGSFVCECNNGFAGNGTTCEPTDCDALTLTDGQIDCPDGAEVGDTCLFACDRGYVLDGSDSRQCTDDGTWTGVEALCVNVNECQIGTNDCDEHATCVDTPGGFECRCSTGWTGDGTSCTDLDECSAATLNDCDADEECVDILNGGGFECIGGLIAHYPLDGTAEDVTGNGNDGTASGLTATADRFGTASSAFAFADGGYVSVPDDPLLDFGTEVVARLLTRLSVPRVRRRAASFHRADARRQVVSRVVPILELDLDVRADVGEDAVTRVVPGSVLRALHHQLPHVAFENEPASQGPIAGVDVAPIEGGIGHAVLPPGDGIHDGERASCGVHAGVRGRPPRVVGWRLHGLAPRSCVRGRARVRCRARDAAPGRSRTLGCRGSGRRSSALTDRGLTSALVTLTGLGRARSLGASARRHGRGDAREQDGQNAMGESSARHPWTVAHRAHGPSTVGGVW